MHVVSVSSYKYKNDIYLENLIKQKENKVNLY